MVPVFDKGLPRFQQSFMERFNYPPHCTTNYMLLRIVGYRKRDHRGKFVSYEIKYMTLSLVIVMGLQWEDIISGRLIYIVGSISKNKSSLLYL